MPPTPVPATPRTVIYYQTHHTPSGSPISVLPLLTTPDAKPTHLILAALHLNAPPSGTKGTTSSLSSSSSSSSSSPSPPAPHLTLNDHDPSNPRNQTLWAELSALRASGVKILALLGGAARGTYPLLDTASASEFSTAYAPIAKFIRAHALDGLDLDVEEPMSLRGIVRLIDQLRSDFGPEFLITLAPVAAALLDARANLSGFAYAELDACRGTEVAWYNAQFYCGWGEAYTTGMYEAVVAAGWAPRKVVLGLVTSPENGSGWVPEVVLRGVLGRLKARYGVGFGGVMGWEYFNSLPGGRERPWEWVALMTRVLRASEPDVLTDEEEAEVQTFVARRMEALNEARRKQEESRRAESEALRKGATQTEMEPIRASYLADGNDINEIEAPTPASFEYFSDGEGVVGPIPPEPFEYFTDGSLEE